ncbi:MAG TPA: acetyl-CoA carboxylase biotin carboxyl carrier protein [Candidatus Binatia bacterium]|nr:acetyl-CoA carboxylase biotin carboxyl carrier protein [Candidatus Binatia bacterium]
MRRIGKRGAQDTPPAVGQGATQVSVQEVSALIRLMDENHLVEIEIESQGSKIRLVKDRPHARAGAHTVPADPVPAPAAAAAHHVPAPERPIDHGKAIISPMVGTFYRAPNPDAPPFVEVGSVVEKGDTLCIIEAMKMMNEIEAEFRGKVARVVAENGQTVEYGESLFMIEPL